MEREVFWVTDSSARSPIPVPHTHILKKGLHGAKQTNIGFLP